MTLNQVVNRIKTISLAHKQVRSFYRGFSQEALTDQRRLFPAVFLEDTGGVISINKKHVALTYRLSFWDLVNVSEDSETNSQEVDSDMLSVAMDVIAQMAWKYDDWGPVSDSNFNLVFSQENGDMYGGVAIDIVIRIPYTQNICAVPN